MLAKVKKAETAPSTGTDSGGSSSGLSKRILKEYSELIRTPVDGWKIFVNETNINSWKAVLTVPQTMTSMPYAGGTWLVTIDFPSQYPFTAPTLRFITPIYHCNISSDGRSCMDILRDTWSPAKSISKALASINELLVSPNPMNPIDAFKGQVCRDDRSTYDKEAKKHTSQHAMEGFDVLAAKYNLV